MSTQRLSAAVRRALRKRLPTANEIVYDYADSTVISFSPTDRGYEGVFAIRTSEDEVKLFFNFGKGLPDPEKLLRGSGKQTRWILVDSAAVLKRPAIVALIEAAIARNKIPFPRKV
jgi:hypothetical protein